VATHTLSPGWSNVVATTVGTVPSFELNRRWVWTKRGHRSLLPEIAPFCTLSAAGLALSTLIVSVSPRPLSPPNGAQLPSHSSPRQLTWPPSDPCGEFGTSCWTGSSSPPDTPAQQGPNWEISPLDTAP